MSNSSFLIMDLMRILTPEEINELTTRYCGEKRVSLTSLMTKVKNKEPKENLAKIIPFTRRGDQEISEDNGTEDTVVFELKAGEQVTQYFNSLYGIKQNSFEGITKEETNVVEIKQKKSASIFILEEKEKSELSQRKLKSTEVIKTYKKVSSVDLEVERGHQEDLAWSSSQGLLINKKQA